MASTRKYADSGATLVELVVAMAIALTVTGIVAIAFAAARRTSRDQLLRTETVHAVRSVLDLLARDVRLAGACLPVSGVFIPIAIGADGELVIRTGVLADDMTCVRSSARQTLPQQSDVVLIDPAAGFEAGMLAYIRHTNGTGEYFTITSVTGNGRNLHKSNWFTQDYPAGSGVYAIDERSYALSTPGTGPPVLTLAVQQGSPLPYALGVEELNINYVLGRNCPPCDVVAQPSATEWPLVNELHFRVRARSPRLLSNHQVYRYTGEISAKPRNLLPGG